MNNAMAFMQGPGLPGKIIGHANREAVREFLRTHIGATNGDVAKALGLSVYSVGRHVQHLRAEWLPQVEGAGR